MTTATDTADVTTSTARAIVRCTRKACRAAHRLDFTTTRVLRAHNGRPVVSRSVTTASFDWPVSYRDRYDLAATLTHGFECSVCGGGGAEFKVVEGRFTESVRCGARCRNAVGSSCDCSCGGERHAEGHAALA